MRYLLLVVTAISAMFLTNCTEDSAITVSEDIVHTGFVAFLAGTPSSLNFGSVYVQEKSTDSVYSSVIIKNSDLFGPTDILTSNENSVILVDKENTVFAGEYDDGMVTFSPSKTMTVDTINAAAVDRNEIGFLLTDKELIKCELPSLDTINIFPVSGNMLTVYGDSVIAIDSASVTIYESGVDQIVKTFSKTLAVTKAVAIGELIYAISTDSNIYTINTTTHAETAITTTGGYTSIAMSEDVLFLGTATTISVYGTLLKYTSTNMIKDIATTRGAVVSLESDTSGINRFEIIDIESMRSVMFQPVSDSVVILEK